MPADPTRSQGDGSGEGEREAPEADLPQAPPGAPEGHDSGRSGPAVPPPGTTPPIGADAKPPADAAAPGAPASGDPGHGQGADGHGHGRHGHGAQGHTGPGAAPGQPGAAPPAGAGQTGGPPAGAGQAGNGEAASPSAAEAAAQLDALTAKAQKADEYLALAQRTQADFENFRRRAARDAANAQERGAVKLALALLPAIDNLDRALAHADQDAGNGAASLVEGLRHVHADVISALGGVGIERYSPEGERFDPQFHEAVAQQPVEGTEPGVVVEVFQRGYRMGDNVVRPARVVVAG